MKCDHIRIYSFTGFGDSDKEIEDATKSLEKKFESRLQSAGSGQLPQLQELSVVRISRSESGSHTRSAKSTLAPRVAVPESLEKTVGVYLVTHGNATSTKAGPELLAETLYKDLIESKSEGQVVKKINLASCKGAGDKLSDPSFRASPLYQLAQHLSTLASQGEVSIDGLRVAGYRAPVMTFDAEAQFVDDLITRRGLVGSLDAGLQKAKENGEVRTAFTSNGNIKESHPQQGADAENSIQKMKNGDAFEKASKQFWESSEKKSKKGSGSGVEPCPTGQELVDFQKKNSAAILRLLREGHETAPHWKAMEDYVKTKLVLEAKGGRFAAVALSKYSQSPDLKEALEVVEETMDKKSRPAEKLQRIQIEPKPSPQS
jgi:hypothetical protein